MATQSLLSVKARNRPFPSQREQGTLLLSIQEGGATITVPLMFSNAHYEAAKSVNGHQFRACVNHGETKAEVVARALGVLQGQRKITFEMNEENKGIVLRAKWPIPSRGKVTREELNQPITVGAYPRVMCDVSELVGKDADVRDLLRLAETATLSFAGVKQKAAAIVR